MSSEEDYSSGDEDTRRRSDYVDSGGRSKRRRESDISMGQMSWTSGYVGMLGEIQELEDEALSNGPSPMLPRRKDDSEA